MEVPTDFLTSLLSHNLAVFFRFKMPLLMKNYFQRWRQENRGIAAPSSSPVDKFNESYIAMPQVTDRPTTSSNIGPMQHDGQRAVRHGTRFKTTYPVSQSRADPQKIHQAGQSHSNVRVDPMEGNSTRDIPSTEANKVSQF